MLTLLAFIVTLGILVTVHEYGHFQVAKWCGVKVLKFSVGFGKPLWSKKFGRDQTEFAIAAIPLGGYVKMLGEDLSDMHEESSTEDLSRAFSRQSLQKRMAIVLAGPIANLLLAILLYWVLFMLGVVGLKPIVGHVLENSPAAKASIAQGDLIQKINGKNADTWQDVRWLLMNESLKNNIVEIKTGNSQLESQSHQMDVSGMKLDEADHDILAELGFSIYQPDMPARIGEVLKDSPAELAGLKTNDLVLSINDQKISNWEMFVQKIKDSPNTPIKILLLRESSEMRFTVVPQSIVENGKNIGRIGAGLKVDQSMLDNILITKNFSPAQAFSEAANKTWETAIFSLKMLGNMLTGNISWKSMSGPVTIASYAGQSANMGIKVYIGFLALISISIGVLNLLPIPLLDGGHFMYYMVEFFTGKPVPEMVLNIGQRLGFIILGCLMVLALFNDMNRLITG